MKKYDKIWVPDEDGEFEAVDIDSDTPELGKLSPEKDVIVLTIAEAIEMWKTATDWSEGKKGALDFNGFMREKGIFSGTTILK